MTGDGDQTPGLNSPALAVALLLVSAPILGQHAELEGIVDLPTADDRQKASLALSRRKDISLDEWLRAMRGFGTFTEQRPGVQRHVVPLNVLGEVEDTELFIYVPRSYDPGAPAPLLLMGHGSSSSGRGQHSMWQDAAEQLGMLVLSPSEASENRGWGFTARERGSALAALRWARRQLNVDENRIFCSGISRGGHMTWDLALRHPDLFAAIAPMVGGPRLSIAGGQSNLRYMENLVHLPICPSAICREAVTIPFCSSTCTSALRALPSWVPATRCCWSSPSSATASRCTQWTGWTSSAPERGTRTRRRSFVWRRGKMKPVPPGWRSSASRGTSTRTSAPACKPANGSASTIQDGESCSPVRPSSARRAWRPRSLRRESSRPTARASAASGFS